MLPRPTRKRWNLHDGPRGSLRRLRSQMAEDGCAESQVVLAKQLLEEQCELEADKISNFKQALEWLICATEQGHKEARILLRRCIHSGVMSETNATIVRAKSCLAASRQESVARKAARDLFASLSNGEEYITTAQLEQRIREISITLQRHASDSDSLEEELTNGDDGKDLSGDGNALLGAVKSLVTNREVGCQDNDQQGLEGAVHQNKEIQNLTVDSLVSAAIDYCQGELPLVRYDLTLTEPGLRALDHIPLFQQAFLHPIVFIQVLYLKLLYYLGSFSFRCTSSELVFFFVIMCFLGTENISLIAPLGLYYLSFVIMVICTFKMLHAKRQFVDFRKWSGLFLRYSDGNLQTDESENLFVKNNLRPFMNFFLALFLNLFLYPFISSQWFVSEFSVLSFVLMFLSLISFGSHGILPNLLPLLSFSINVLAKYPYEKDTVVNQGWRFLDLHIQGYPSYIIGSSIEFCLNARVFFTLLIPVIIFVMAKRDNWQGTFKYALPHCVTLSWLQIFISSSQGATMYGLIRGTLALVGIFLFLPIVGTVTLLLPILAFLQGVTLSNILYTTAVVVCFVASVLVSCLLSRVETTKKYITAFELVFGLIALVFLGNHFLGHMENDISSTILQLIDEKKPELSSFLKAEFDYDNIYQISWEDYYGNCHQPSWTETNMATTQIKCSVLNGAKVDWEGLVREVEIQRMDNKWNTFAEYLPGFFKEIFKCYYGEEYIALCQNNDSPCVERECDFIQKVAKQSGKGCHLNNFNRYTYQVKMQLNIGGLLKKHTELAVSLEHDFSNFTRLLRTGDKIRIRGVLLNEDQFTLGTPNPIIKAYELSCVHCDNSVINGLRINSKIPSSWKFAALFSSIIHDITVSGKHVLNFILNPILVFK